LINDKRAVNNRFRWLLVVALVSLAAVLAIFASQLDLTKEPDWLANLTPAEHFFVHVVFFLCGSVFGACVALMAIKASPHLVKNKRRERAMSSSGGARYPPA
jgi:hypothetical protein